MASEHAPSPGNSFSSGEPPMRMPHLEFIYRIVAFMDANSSAIPNVLGNNVFRMILPIAGGTVRGPHVNGEIVKNSGADWAQRIGVADSKSLTRLNARYTLKTDDGHFILVNAVGTFAAGPEARDLAAARRAGPLTVSQDNAEYFTHITFEAAGESPYGWMNSVVAVGVMTMVEGKPVIDCYRLTNFPGRGTAYL